MSLVLRGLTRGNLVALADSVRTGRLGPPFSPFSLSRVITPVDVEALAAELNRLSAQGATAALAAEILEMIAAERDAATEARDQLELVWTGPSAAGEASRDTGVVVRELFGRAERRVLVSGFAVYQGKEIFRVLAERMELRPELAVRMFLNVSRDGMDDSRPAEQVLAHFAADFRTGQWPGSRLPEVFFDPRSLEMGGTQRASLHAKCIVVDEEAVLVTSANFTEAAQSRNIEAGLLVRDSPLARTLSGHFERLVESSDLCRIAGL